MRLLQLEHSGEFSLTEDYTEDVPPYAILSHTWGKDTEEVTFDDFRVGTYTGKTGYRKIQFCGEQAARDGLQYFWVDSCCINKSNYTELSEAINSMFNWYWNAAKCYVYLSDVSTRSDADESLSQSLWISEFRHSRWFTRAWTLQELIAPHSVEFFSREGERLGDKKSLEPSLHEITSIPVEVLRGNPLTQFSIEERMLWAAERTAKRKEDEAYCLLGIFGLHMPLIYGEGRENAFIRLEEEIGKRSIGANIHGTVHWTVPRAVNSLFTGRSHLLSRIQKALEINSISVTPKQRRFVITGLGGQGKSEICLQVASLMKQQFWGVFWVDVGKASTAESDLIAIAKRLGQHVESLCDALQVLANTKESWLLILDNADDPNFDYQAYFPSGTHGAVLITSRVSHCKRYSPDENEALEGLEDKDSQELLLKAADIPKESWPSYRNQAEKVVQLLGSHTLALIQAGAYVAKGHCQLHEYPKVYQRQRERLLRYRPEQARSRYHDVYATFEASAEVLEQSESEVAKDALYLLAILSVLDSAILPLQIFQSAWDGSREVLNTSHEETSEIDVMSRSHVLRLPGFLIIESDEWDPFRLTEASSKLASLSLVMWHDLGGLVGVSMHPLTHAWAKDRQDPEQQGLAWITAGCVLALSRSNYMMWQTQERRLLPHIQSYLDTNIKRVLLFGSEVIVVPILLNCGRALLDARQDSRLSHLLEDLFTELNKNPEEPSKDSLQLYNLQARSLMNMGENKEAIKLLEQVVEISKTTQAETHPDRLNSQLALAWAYLNNRQVAEVIKLLEQVVKICKTTLAETHPDRLSSQQALAWAYQANGQIAKAIKLLKQEVEINKTTLDETHLDRLSAQHILARVYQTDGQIVEAIKLLEYVVEIELTTLAETHPDRLASQHALAQAYQADGQIAKAIKLLEYVVEIKSTTLAETHINRLASQHELARAYQADGQIAKAIKLLEYVVEIKSTTLAETHPDRLASQQALAQAYQADGQIAKAIKLLEHVVEINKTTLAETHLDRLTSENNLAQAYQADRQIAEAIKLLEHVVGIRKTTLAETHPDRLTSENNLAQAYQADGQIAEAIKLLEHVVGIRKTTLAETHPHRLTSQHNLALAYQADGQIAEAIKLLEHVVGIRKMTLAETHPDRLTSQHALAWVYQENRQVTETIKPLED